MALLALMYFSAIGALAICSIVARAQWNGLAARRPSLQGLALAIIAMSVWSTAPTKPAHHPIPTGAEALTHGAVQGSILADFQGPMPRDEVSTPVHGAPVPGAGQVTALIGPALPDASDPVHTAEPETSDIEPLLVPESVAISSDLPYATPAEPNRPEAPVTIPVDV